MIEIKNKKSCTGCFACIQICPKQCMSMQPDEEGFLYPVIDKDRCINCGLCEKICPATHPFSARKPLAVYASRNKEEKYRLRGSSGGVFLPLAEKVIAKGGVVFGANFDKNWNVIHSHIDKPEGLSLFSGSKYVQSQIGDTYRVAENYLKTGREVLFSGTPCQIAGLHAFLRKRYNNLYTVDFICHGVPSPQIWQTYLKEISEGIQKEHPDISLCISNINFRDKISGWNDSSVCIHYQGEDQQSVTFCEKKSRNLYLRGFLQNLYLRPSCHHCPCKNLSSDSDITLGDFWGIGKICPEFNDNQGSSAVLINTDKGRILWTSIDTDRKEVTFDQVIAGNGALTTPAVASSQRSAFFKEVAISSDFLCKQIRKHTSQNHRQNIYKFIGKLLRKIIK